MSVLQAPTFGNLRSQSRRPPLQPLCTNSLVSAADEALSPSEDNETFSAHLPEGLLTPVKDCTQQSSQLLSGNASEAPDGSPAVWRHQVQTQYSLFDQSQDRVSFSTTCTPTSIFRRLKTASPEAGACSQQRRPQFALSQNDDPRQKALPQSYAGQIPPMALVPQKRARPVQRGIHPAEINKRITTAQHSWQILDIVNTFGAEFDAVNVATALHRIAKQKPDDLLRLTSSDGFKQLVIMVDIQVCCLQSFSLATEASAVALTLYFSNRKFQLPSRLPVML